MPQVISSSYSVGDTQADGRHWIIESLVLDVGEPLSNQYLADGDADLAAHLADTVAATNATFIHDANMIALNKQKQSGG